MLTNKNTKKIIVNTVVISVFVAILICYGYFAFIHTNAVSFYCPKRSYDTTKYVAHRGDCSRYYQNTYQAFESAMLDPFFDGIETDVWRTKDGVWVCAHDNTPFADKSIKITDNNFSDISDIPLDPAMGEDTIDKSINYTLATLDDYIDCVRPSTYAFVEIKQNYPEMQLKELMEILQIWIPYDKLIICSFNLELLQSINRISPTTQLLIFTSKPFVAYTYTLLGFSVGVNKKIIDTSFVNRLEKRQRFSYVYTALNPSELPKFTDLKVDFVATDFSVKL